MKENDFYNILQTFYICTGVCCQCGRQFRFIAYGIILANLFTNLDIELEQVAIAGVAVTAVSFILGMSPISSFVEFLKLPVRGLSNTESQRIEPLVSDLREKYKDKYAKNLKNKVYVVDDPEPSATAYAFGRIALSSSLINKFDDDIVKSVLAHEIGHQHHKDTFYYQSLFACGSIHKVFSYVFDIFSKILEALPGLISFIPMILSLPIIFIMSMRYFLLAIIISLNDFFSKTNEYRADNFAKSVAGKEGLIKFLELAKLEEKHNDGTMLNMYVRSHPPSEFRIERLNGLTI